MLVLAPAACCLAGVALHQLLLTLTRSLHASPQAAAVDAAAPTKDAVARKPSKVGKVRRSARQRMAHCTVLVCPRRALEHTHANCGDVVVWCAGQSSTSSS